MPALDQRAIAKAEAALEKMSGQFAEWIKEELAHLLEAWAASRQNAPGSPAAKSELHRRAHDLKGLAPTYGYPLVGRICATLCKLTGDEHGEISAPDRLLKAHVDAVKAAVLGKIKGADHPVGLALVAELEAQTKEIIAQQAAEAAAKEPPQQA
jgi:HPt (histidine-containing phosphotransfer) domain-containing protein